MATDEMATPVQSPGRPGDEWFFAGLASSFPDITDSNKPYFKLAWPQPCRPSTVGTETPGCRVFHPRKTTAEGPARVEEIDVELAVGQDAWIMKEQVLVFQYRGRFHAVDHACPHRAYSLSWGQPFDIEDAGKVVGTGIRCKGHSYAFELSTGIGDRGNYRLGVWEVELRPAGGLGIGGAPGDAGEKIDEKEREVWVRRKKAA